MSAIIAPVALAVPGPAAPSAADVVEHDLLATLNPLGRAGRIWIASLFAVCATALAAYIYQLSSGLHVTAMRNYVSWGTYMTNFVFFIGISHAGTLISAILRVTNAGWRRPITRMAEAITVLALMVGASMVVIDMGRPDRVWELLRYGRLQSPILWDLVSVTTYITGSFLYLYVAMIPDMPILARMARERGRSPLLVRFYEKLSLGYRESPEHRRRLARALGAMAVIIIPVAISVHTVVSWVFGMTLRPGWHSTIFGPYFVIGAIFSGTAAIITAMIIFRRAYHLERYLLPEHFRKLATLLLALSLLYAYFTLSEYLTAYYGGIDADARLLELLAGNTAYGVWFWLWAIFGLFVPIGLLLIPSRRSLTSIVTASVLINIGMWLKRYLIIVPTLQTPFIPAQAAGIKPEYFPSVVEITITIGAFSAFLLLFTLFSRIFPILSIWETEEDAAEARGTLTITHAPVRTGLAPGAVVTLVLGLGLASLVPSHHAQAQGQPPSGGIIELARATVDSQPMLMARVTANGRPVAHAVIVFSVSRTFGFMDLGKDTTAADGTAKVALPSAIPVDAHNELVARASVESPDSLALPVEVRLAGGAARAPAPWMSTAPRALWSTHAPVAMVATIVCLLLTVWITYGFVVSQLIAMHNIKSD